MSDNTLPDLDERRDRLIRWLESCEVEDVDLVEDVRETDQGLVAVLSEVVNVEELRDALHHEYGDECETDISREGESRALSVYEVHELGSGATVAQKAGVTYRGDTYEFPLGGSMNPLIEEVTGRDPEEEEKMLKKVIGGDTELVPADDTVAECLDHLRVYLKYGI